MALCTVATWQVAQSIIEIVLKTSACLATDNVKSLWINHTFFTYTEILKTIKHGSHWVLEDFKVLISQM